LWFKTNSLNSPDFAVLFAFFAAKNQSLNFLVLPALLVETYRHITHPTFSSLKPFFHTLLNVIGLACFVVGALFLFVLGTSVGLPMHTPGVAALGVGALLLTLSAVVFHRDKLNYQPSTIIETIFLLSFVYLVWRCWVSPVRYLAELDLFLLAIAANTILVCRFTPNWKFFVKVFTVVIGSFAIVQFLIYCYQVIVDPSFEPWAILDLTRPSEKQHGMNGFFFHRNPAGGFNAMLAAYLGGWLLYGRLSLLLRFAITLCWSAAVANTLMTFSRSAFLALVVGHVILLVMLLFFGLGAKMKIWKRIVLGFGVFGLGCVSFIATNNWAERLAVKRFGEDAEIDRLAFHQGRDGPWDSAMSMFMDSPIFGHGSRMFEVKEYAYWPSDLKTLRADMVYVHNDYLQALSDYGMIGGIIVILVLLLSAGMVIRLSTRSLPGRTQTQGVYQGRAIAAGCAGLIGATAADNFFSFSWHFPPIVFLTALAIGMLLRSVGSLKVDGDENPVIESSGRIVLMVIWLAVGGVVIGYSGIVGGRYGYAYWSLKFLELKSKSGELSDEVILDQYGDILKILPRFPYYLEGGELAHRIALSPELDRTSALEFMEESYSYLSAAVRLNPMNCPVRRELARTCLLLGRYDEAVLHLEKGAEIGEPREIFYQFYTALAEVHVTQAVEALRTMDFDQASRSLRAADEALINQTRFALWFIRDDRVDPRFSKYKELRKFVTEEIEFLKRTGEWKESRKRAAPDAIEIGD